MPRLLWTSYWRYLAGNLWLLLLSICAIATGVAVILGIDVASISAQRSFALSTQALTGQATHSLVGTGRGVDETVYRKLRVDGGFRRSAPVVEGYVSFPEEGADELSVGPTLTLVGVDLLADRAIRDWTGGRLEGSRRGENYGLTRIIGSSNQVVLAAPTALRLGWKVGQERAAQVGGRRLGLVLAGVFEAGSPSAAAALDNLVLADISTAQTILGQQGTLDRIDFVLTPNEEARLEKMLPAGLALQPAGTSQQTAGELSSAFHLSLRALSYLSLLVATFLIFNVVSFSIAHRRQSLGRLRILGVTSGELGRLLVGEALLLGTVGSLLGVLGGLALGRGLVPLVTRTVNDLYYVQAITRFAVAPSLLAKAFLCGFGATLTAALIPAVLAARTPPLDLLHRVAGRDSNRRGALLCALAGLVFLTVAVGLILMPGLLPGLASLLAVVLGYGLLVPGALMLSVMAGRRLSRALSFRMALEGLSAHLERSGTAAVALTVAVAATVSIAMMVTSFRGTLISWLDTTLSADIYLSLKDRAGVMSGATLDPVAVAKALALPGLEAWSGQRIVIVPSETGETLLIGVRAGGDYEASLQFLELADRGWERFGKGEGVFLTEPYSRRAKKGVGDTLELSTPSGTRQFPVLGVYYSFAPDRNSALLGSAGFEPLFGRDRYSGLGLYAKAGETRKLVGQLKRIFGEGVEVRATGDLRRLALEIFERTFTVTEVLRFLALGVALIGVVLSLMALAFERDAEVKVLRALGMQRGELFALGLMQSAWLGVVTGLLACPLGMLLAKIMISVVNRRAFGWTISFLPDYQGMVVSLTLGVLASLAAGVYPAWKWSQGGADDALRERD